MIDASAETPSGRRDPSPELPALRTRPIDGHKGTFGRAVLVAGAPGLAGAAVLAARAALRSGAGLVTVAAPESLGPLLAGAAPEATFLGLRTTPPLRAAEARAALGSTPIGALGLGPGVGPSAPARRFAIGLASSVDAPQVIDADALNAVADGHALPPRDDRIWTPHPGEFRRLTGTSPVGERERRAAAADFVAQRGGIVILKGHRSVVRSAQREYINATGNPGMAKGGAGDVLTGFLTGLLAQGYPAWDAAVLGVFIHGLAGDLARAALGEEAMTAGDIIDHLAAAFRVVASRGASS